MLLAAEIVPRDVQNSLGACLIHIYAMQSNPETRRDEKRIPAYPASGLAAESSPSVCIHSNTEIHCCEEKISSSVLLITKRKERGEAFFMVSTELLHYNYCCLYTDGVLCSLARLRVETRICLSISARQEGRGSTESSDSTTASFAAS